jgi:hypothetical protein
MEVKILRDQAMVYESKIKTMMQFATMVLDAAWGLQRQAYRKIPMSGNLVKFASSHIYRKDKFSVNILLGYQLFTVNFHKY